MEKEIEYVRPILPHVHLRWHEYESVPFLGYGFEDAEQVGAIATIEQPNTELPLTNQETIESRMRYAEPHRRGVIHRVHIGLTNDENQVISAYQLAANPRFTHSNSVKGFDGHSTGNMGILDPAIRRRNWMLAGSKSGLDFRGVVMKHNENEEQYAGEFDPNNPITHSYRQNEGAEVVSVLENFRNIYDADFRGVFYIAHASSPETIELANSERGKLPCEIVIETCGHHEFLNWEDYAHHGLDVKMNPPLRSRKNQERVLEYVVEGKTDITGDDHAPHTIKKKSEGASGIPAIAFLPKRIELLRELGIKESQLVRLLFGTANEIFFDRELSEEKVKVRYNPKLWKKYGWNPFSRIDGSS